MTVNPGPVTAAEQEQVERANASDQTPVVFVHGLWLLPSSWDRWRELFEASGYVALAPGWPNDPETVQEARDEPDLLAGNGVEDVTEHYAEVIRRLDRPPVVVGHSFGGLITQQLAGRGLAAASVAISPAPGRGVLALPVSSLKASFPALRNPLNVGRSVMLTYDQFRFAFANAVDEVQAKRLYDAFAVPAPAKPLFQAASANLNPASATKVDVRRPDRGPLKLIAAGRDHTVPWAITSAWYSRQLKNQALTQIECLADRGHSLVIDDGWEAVARNALDFLAGHRVPASGAAAAEASSSPS